MTTLSQTISDSATLFRRNLRHTRRQPGMLLVTAVIPVIFLALFGVVLGGALGAGLGLGRGSEQNYIDYLVPGMLLLVACTGAGMTAYAVALDLDKGIVARLSTMAIARSAILVGHVAGSTLRTLIGTGLVLGVAFLMGFRPTTDPVRWLGVLLLTTLMAMTIAWLAVALGISASSPETANTPTLLLQLLVFTSSAYVRPEGMPEPLRWFAEHQPFSVIIEAMRGLLFGAPVGNTILIAALWCLGLTCLAYLLAMARLNREQTS